MSWMRSVLQCFHSVVFFSLFVFNKKSKWILKFWTLSGLSTVAFFLNETPLVHWNGHNTKFSLILVFRSFYSMNHSHSKKTISKRAFHRHNKQHITYLILYPCYNIFFPFEMIVCLWYTMFFLCFSSKNNALHHSSSYKPSNQFNPLAVLFVESHECFLHMGTSIFLVITCMCMDYITRARWEIRAAKWINAAAAAAHCVLNALENKCCYLNGE